MRTAFPSATISVWLVDLELHDSIRVFPDQCVTLPRIGIAILNVGLMNMSYAILPATKHEVMMQAMSWCWMLPIVHISSQPVRSCSS
jgi:hypothetical protein